MVSTNPYPLPRERKLILSLLLILAAASWALLIWQSAAMNSQAMGMGLTMGMSTGLFIVIWVVMMIAMMFPTAAPMILMFMTVYAGKRQKSQAFVPTWVFVSAYLLIWTLFGLVAYPLALLAESVAGQSGVQAGDILLEVNHTAVKDVNKLQCVLDGTDDASEALILIQRKRNAYYVVLQGS